MSYYPRFAQLLDQYLNAADRSGSWLAQRLGVNPGTVTRWRQGESRPSKPGVVAAVASALGVTAADKRRELMGAAGYVYVEDESSEEGMARRHGQLPDLQMARHFSFRPDLTSAVLVATLGSEPQVIAIATQLLLRQREPLSAVQVLHTLPTRPPISRALPALQECFAHHAEWPRLETIPLPIDDTIAPDQIERFARTLFSTLKQWIETGARVHLLLAGGRKSMAMVGITVAQLLLGPDDRVWYLYSADELRFSGKFVLEPGDDATLIQVPLPQMRPAPAVYTQPFRAETPAAAFEALENEQSRQLKRFVEHELTPAERELASIVATDVLSVAEIATRLHKQPKTVSNQLNAIYAKLEAAFGLQPDKGLKREFLRNQLQGYFQK